jgi:alanine racemase
MKRSRLGTAKPLTVCSRAASICPMAPPYVSVNLDLDRVRRNTAEVKARVGVELWATVKADAYGLGAARVAEALAGGVDGFCVFSLEEATAIDLWNRTGKPAIAMGPPTTLDPQAWIAAHVRPAVTTVDQARTLADTDPILCVDTGMQRFACPAAEVGAVLEAGRIREAFTHATRVEHARRLRQITAGHSLKLHAAATALLNEPEARLDAVRPGLALYQGALTVTAKLLEARRSSGPIGYGGWTSETGHHGTIGIGYAHGLRPGPVTVNGRRQRTAEVGMQSAYVTLDPADRVGDRVTLLGDGLTEFDVATAWGTPPHQILLSMAKLASG